MNKNFHNLLKGISVLPALLVMPAVAEVVVTNTTYPDAIVRDQQSEIRGGAFEFRDGATFQDTVTFTNNFTTSTASNYGLGGAIFADKDSTNDVVFTGDASFSGNHAVAGGAIYSQQGLNNSDTAMIFLSDATFANNYSTGSGGAFVNQGNVVFNGDVTFSGNGKNGNSVTTQTGGGFFNSENTAIFEKSVTFTGNAASNSGSGFGNAGTMIIKQGLTATYNTDSLDPNVAGNANNGAISNGGTLSVYGGDINISNNTAGKKAGGQNSGILLFGAYQDGDDIVQAAVDNITFKDNTSTVENGAALFVHESSTTTQLYGNNILFENNDSAGLYGGALWTDDETFIKGANITFKDNDANGTTTNSAKIWNFGGGAIQNRGFTQGHTDLVVGLDDGSSIILFDNNTSATNGGALHIRASESDAVANTTIQGTITFSNNHADLKGGAISNYVGEGSSVLTLDPRTSFINNSATDGGAIFNQGGYENDSVLTLTGGVFSGNQSTERGGAIFNYGNMEISNAVFTGNKTTDLTWNAQGGAIFNSGDAEYLDVPAILTISNTTFGSATDASLGNSAMQGGAIANENDLSDGVITLNNVNFYNNKAYADTDDSDGYNSTLGGAIWNQGMMTVNGNTMFRGNTASGYNVQGGAIYNSGTLIFNDEVTFVSNTATDINSGDGAFGGAVSNAYSAQLVFNKFATFTNNKALTSADEETQGGAINNQNIVTFAKGASFTGNQATYGGAIFNESNLSIAEGSTFTSNVAGDEGGALFNYGGTVSLTDASFTNNSAGYTGGAITTYGGVINLNAKNSDVVFSGNTANNIANDIKTYGNSAQINLNAADGRTISMDGGITGTGIVNINTGANQTGNVDISGLMNIANINIANGNVSMTGDINGNSLTIADGATLNIGSASVTESSINLDGTMLATLKSGSNSQITTNSFTGDGLLKLSFDKAGTYNVFGNADFANIDISSPVYDLSWENGTVTVSAKSAESIVAANAGISQDTAKVVSALAQSDNAQASELTLAIQDALANGDAAYIEQEVSKMNPEKAPVVTSVALSVQNQVLTAAGERMALPLTGRSGGDVRADLGVWAKGMYNRTKHKDIFTGNTWGGSVGIDTDLNHSVILGAGYSFGDTNVDLHTHDVDIDSNTIFVYGQYRNSDWFVNGTIAYTMSDYQWHKNIFGVNNNPEYKVNSLSEQIMAGYHLQHGITPTLGLRYLDVHQDSYQDGLLTVMANDTKYLTGVLGVDYKQIWIAPNTSLFWNPELHIAATYDMLSDAAMAVVTIPGASAYTIESENLSRLGGEFGFGITAEYYYLTVSLNYDLNVHQDYTSHTGSLKLKYKF